MSKPIIHAQNSAKRFGGKVEDYLTIHQKMDSTKAAHAEVSHRCVFHSSYGVFLVEDLFGLTIKNSDGLEISTREIAEQHVIEDLGFVPSLSDWLHELVLQPWMQGSELGKPGLRDEL